MTAFFGILLPSRAENLEVLLSEKVAFSSKKVTFNAKWPSKQSKVVLALFLIHFTMLFLGFSSAIVAIVGFYYRAASRHSKMSINTDLPVILTSQAIQPSADGKYPFDQMSFLFPHEPLRREMARGKAAFDAMDASQHPWKVKYMKIWLEEFLIPVIKDHHDSEEFVFDPSYEKLGVSIPNKFHRDHQDLMTSLTSIASLVSSCSENPQNINKVRKEYMKLFTLMGEHLQDEEKFWPSVILERNYETYRAIHDAMHVYAKGQKSGKNFLMSVFDSMGYEFDPSAPCHVIGDTRWCGEEQALAVINKIPYFVRAWIFPSYNRKYQYYKSLVNAVAKETEDKVPLESDGGCVVC